MHVNSPRSASREDTAAPRQKHGRAARAAAKHGAKRPRGLLRSKSGLRLRSIFLAAKNRASRKNALSSRLQLAPRGVLVGCDRPGSAARICRWRGAGLVASRGRGAGALASLAGCPAELALDALTIELTGRFIGRIRQRDEQILRTQPIV